MSLIVLDTDVASGTLRNRLSSGPQRVAGLARWRERVAVLQYDEAVAVKWGQLQARAQQRGRPWPQIDTYVGSNPTPATTYNSRSEALQWC